MTQTCIWPGLNAFGVAGVFFGVVDVEVGVVVVFVMVDRVFFSEVDLTWTVAGTLQLCLVPPQWRFAMAALSAGLPFLRPFVLGNLPAAAAPVACCCT